MKTTAPTLNATRLYNPKVSRFAQYDDLLLELAKKYPSRSGRNISFRKAFLAEPGLHKKLNNEPVTLLRGYVTSLLTRRSAGTNGTAHTEPPADDGIPKITTNNRQQSAHAVHNKLLLELWRKYPNATGGNISFAQAFKADPTLPAQLGVKTQQNLHALEQHTRKLIRAAQGLPIKTYPRQTQHKKAARLEVIPVAAEEPPPTANYCWNCGAPHTQVNQALALMAKLRRRV